MTSTLLGGGWVRSYGFSRTVLALAGAGALLIAGGCGNTAADTSDTTGGASDGTSTGATTGGTTMDADDAGATSGATGGTTAGTDSTGGTTAGTTGGTSAGTTAGTMVDGGMSTGGTAGSSDIASTPGNDSPTATACAGTTTCSYATQTCCVSGVGDAMCIEGKKCPTGGLIPAAPTVCDGPEDCTGGKVCCVAVNPTGATNSCQDSCDKVSGLIGVWQLCHKDKDCPANKDACDADDTFPFWGFCG